VRRISRRVGILGDTLIAPICGWDGRHATGHSFSFARLGAQP
jgi:hypothetical protein